MAKVIGASLEGWAVGALPLDGGGAEESRLLSRARGGDRAAFESLYRLHVGRVYALCLRLAGSAAEAEELTQETFVRTWERLPDLDPGGRLNAWLRRVAVNLVCDRLRARRRRGRPESFDEVVHAGVPGGASRPRPPSLDLEAAIAGLPARARTTFVLFDVYGYGHEEIAALTGMAVGTSKAQLHRARELLRRALRP